MQRGQGLSRPHRATVAGVLVRLGTEAFVGGRELTPEIVLEVVGRWKSVIFGRHELLYKPRLCQRY